MKLIRENIFETNSSSTHSFVYLKRGYKLPEQIETLSAKGTVLPVNWSKPNFRVEIRNFMDGADNSDLTHPEWMASYLFTMLHLMKCRLDWNGDHTEEDVNEALEQFHKMMLENNLTPKYGPIILEYHVFDYNWRHEAYMNEKEMTASWELKEAYMEFNDGGCIESLQDIWKIIDTPEHFKDFLTKTKIRIKYDG